MADVLRVAFLLSFRPLVVTLVASVGLLWGLGVGSLSSSLFLPDIDVSLVPPRCWCWHSCCYSVSLIGVLSQFDDDSARLIALPFVEYFYCFTV